MDPKRIKSLLEKYYNGESSLEEEEILLKYFKGEKISNEFIADKDIFLFNQDEKERNDDLPDLTEELWDGIENSEKHQNKKGLRIKTFTLIRVAAGIVILFGAYFLLQDHFNSKSETIKFADTYNDPEKAYQETKKTLLYVSQLLNSGTNHLEPINKIEEGASKLNTLSSFNKGLKELDPVKKYTIADKYIKQ